MEEDYEDYQEPNPEYIYNDDGDSYLGQSQPYGAAPPDNILDRNWAKSSFLMSDSRLADTNDLDSLSQEQIDDLNNRYWSSASRKFTDTRIGGSVAVNNRPQFGPYTDIRVKGRLSGRNNVTKDATAGNYGMGRYYSESLDDNGQTVYLRFGVPQYNSLANFFVNAFDGDLAGAVNTGRAKSWTYTVGTVLGTFFTVVTFPVLSATIVGSRIVAKFFTRATSKFYTMKPLMYQYWLAVDMLVNAWVVNRGLMPKFPFGNISSQRIGDPTGMDQDFIDQMHAKFPTFFNEQGRVDIFSVCLRAQSIANKLFMEEYNSLKSSDPYDFTGYVRKAGQVSKETVYVTDQAEHKMLGYLAAVTSLTNWFGKSQDTANTLSESNPKIDPATGQLVEGMDTDQSSKDESWFDKFITFLDAEMSQGAAFAVFRVDNTGATSESFSNSVMESDISQKINSQASNFRQVNFSLAGGNIGEGMIANALESVAGGVKDLALGALNGLTLGISGGVEAALAGSYIDIPKSWQSASANLPKASYTMQLIAPYGHPLSQLQNIIIPLCMILAGVLPRSTGKQSYGPPFLCQVYDRGRCQIQLGMIESMSIARGTSNLNFTNRGQAMGVDVSFSIVDLSSIMHMPISTGTFMETLKTAGTSIPLLDEDNVIFDYLACLGGLDIYNQIYPLPRARLKAASWYMNLQKFSSPAWAAMAFHDSYTSGVLSYTPVALMQVLEFGARGTDIATGPF